MTNHLQRLVQLLERLDRAHIYFTLAHNQEDAVSVQVVVPGERWEIDCYPDGTIDVEVFKSDGKILNETIVEDLFARFAE